MSEVSPARSSPVLLAAGMALLHGIVAAPLLYELRVRVPEKLRVFREFNMKLPAATQYYADASLWFGAPVGNLLVLLGFLVVDGFFLWFLLRKQRTLAWLWFLAVIVLLLLLAGGAEWAMELAQRKLDEALSRP
jgi:type II secretory pathway component PulF